jgi:hypothetical protein
MRAGTLHYIRVGFFGSPEARRRSVDYTALVSVPRCASGLALRRSDGVAPADYTAQWAPAWRSSKSRNCGFLSGLKALTPAAISALLSLLLCVLLSTLSLS